MGVLITFFDLIVVIWEVILLIRWILPMERYAGEPLLLRWGGVALLLLLGCMWFYLPVLGMSGDLRLYICGFFFALLITFLIYRDRSKPQ